MLKISTQVELRNIGDGKKLSFYQTIGSSSWLETLTASQNWVKQQEELRLENQRRPNTQWAYEKNLMLYVKVVLDRQSLNLGLGCLPDWLRNKPGLHSLDIYRDNLCLFRCIAVHRGAHVRDNIRRTRELAETFFAQHPGLRNRLTERHLPLLEKHFKQGIAAYTVQPNGDFLLTHLPANYDKVGRPALNGHLRGARLLDPRHQDNRAQLHLWGLSGQIHKVLRLGSSRKPLHRRADQNQLPEQTHPRPCISL